LQENRKGMIKLQTSAKTSKQDDTTRTRTPKPGYLKLTNTCHTVQVNRVHSPPRLDCNSSSLTIGLETAKR
jgi:hypothetical protein